MCLSPILVRVIYDGIICPKTPFQGLAPISEVKCPGSNKIQYCPPLPRMCLTWQISADPDETLRYAASPLDLRYFKCSLFEFLLLKCINHVPAIAYIGF